MNINKIKQFNNELNTPFNISIKNSLSNNNIVNACINNSIAKNHNHLFSNKVSIQGKATNQKSSGRCWLFAALNVIRVQMIKKYDLEKDFELSQSYLFFWDKLERANYFIETLFTLQKSNKLEKDDRLLWHLLDCPMGDGGQWDMITSLVEKYGIVPKSIERESFSSSCSRHMNSLLTNKLREYASFIYENKDNNDFLDNKENIKNVMMKTIYEILYKTLGEPIFPDQEFVWRYEDKKNKIHDLKTNPLDFYKNHIPFDMKEYICIINDPRNDYNKLYSVEHLGNVWDTKFPVLYLNLQVDEIKKLIKETILEDEPVWFGCDVGKERHSDLSLMDTNIINFGDAFNTNFKVMDKKTQLIFRESLMTHAMVFTGFDQDEEGNITKLLVENSWGSKGDTNGYYTMTSEWFDKYVYEIAINKNKLTKEQLELLKENNITKYNFWDPMGALAK